MFRMHTRDYRAFHRFVAAGRAGRALAALAGLGLFAASVGSAIISISHF